MCLLGISRRTVEVLSYIGTHLRNQYTNIHLLVAEIRHSKKESKRCDVTRMWNIAHDFEMDIRDKNVYA